MRHCLKCDREINWLDIVSPALERVHDKRTIAEVILGETRYLSVDVPDSIRAVMGDRDNAH